MKTEQKSWKGDQTGNSNPKDPRPRLWLCVFGVLSEKASQSPYKDADYALKIV